MSNWTGREGRDSLEGTAMMMIGFDKLGWSLRWMSAGRAGAAAMEGALYWEWKSCPDLFFGRGFIIKSKTVCRRIR